MQLAGGTASMQQLKERLEKDLLEVYILTIEPLSILFRVQGFIGGTCKSVNKFFNLLAEMKHFVFAFFRLELNIFSFSIRLVDCFYFYLKKINLLLRNIFLKENLYFFVSFGVFLRWNFHL